MANSTITQRQVQPHTSPVIVDNPKPSTRTPKFAANIDVSFSCCFSIPSSPNEALHRILRNLALFKAYYAIFIWTVLVITLIPMRKWSLLLLLVNTNFSAIYALLLKAFPGSRLLHRWIDKRVVACAIVLATAVEMLLTEAGLHLVFTLVGTIPVTLIHAVIQETTGEYHMVEDQDEGAVERILDAV